MCVCLLLFWHATNNTAKRKLASPIALHINLCIYIKVIETKKSKNKKKTKTKMKILCFWFSQSFPSTQQVITCRCEMLRHMTHKTKRINLWFAYSHLLLLGIDSYLCVFVSSRIKHFFFRLVWHAKKSAAAKIHVTFCSVLIAHLWFWGVYPLFVSKNIQFYHLFAYIEIILWFGPNSALKHLPYLFSFTNHFMDDIFCLPFTVKCWDNLKTNLKQAKTIDQLNKCAKIYRILSMEVLRVW